MERFIMTTTIDRIMPVAERSTKVATLLQRRLEIAQNHYKDRVAKAMQARLEAATAQPSSP
jgi:hypothetical protein